MKKRIKDGGPAFPTGTGVTPYNPGMTLRDYFAAKAMQALLMHPSGHGEPDEVIAGASYEMADAMLLAREVK